MVLNRPCSHAYTILEKCIQNEKDTILKTSKPGAPSPLKIVLRGIEAFTQHQRYIEETEQGGAVSRFTLLSSPEELPINTSLVYPAVYTQLQRGYLFVSTYDLLEKYLFQLCLACQANFQLNSHIHPVHYNVYTLLEFLNNTVGLDLTNVTITNINTNNITTLDLLHSVRNVVVNNKAQVMANESLVQESLHPIGIGVNDIGELVFSYSSSHIFSGHCISLMECLRDGLVAKMSGVGGADSGEVAQSPSSSKQKLNH